MSIGSRGVTIQKQGRNYWLLIILTFVELVFSFLLVVSLASNLLFPQRVSAIAGVSAKLSYQGRLTDLSGNPLGGSGTNYCFRFSIYDAASGGTRIWPAGVPASTTVKVEDGVFNTDIGTADSLATLDFSANDTVFLNVEVNATPTTCTGAWEQLDLRQRIDSVGYARAAEGVYSSLLRAPTGGTAVQIGTGAGAATPIFLNLDVKNTQEAVDASCSTNGQLWYNSADSRARVCQGSIIRDMIDGILVQDEGTNQGRASTALNFTGGGVSASKGVGGVININIPDRIGGIAVNALTTYTSGTVVISAGANITLGTAGQTITISAPAGGGGGGGADLSAWRNDNEATIVANAAMSGASFSKRPIFVPLNIQGSNLSVKTIEFLASRLAGTSLNMTYGAAFYTYSNSTRIDLLSSTTHAISLTASSQFSGLRRYRVTGLSNLVLSGGEYILALYVSGSNNSTVVANLNIFGAQTHPVNAGFVFPGTNSTAVTATASHLFPFQGVYSNTTAAFPASVALTQIAGQASNVRAQPLIKILEIS